MFEVPKALDLENLFIEFGESTSKDIKNKVDCLTFLSRDLRKTPYSLYITCKKTRKTENYLVNEIPLIIEKNEKLFVEKFNHTITAYIYSFGSSDNLKAESELFHINNVADYNLNVYRIINDRGIVLASLVISSSITLLLYLIVSIVLNIFYRNWL